MLLRDYLLLVLGSIVLLGVIIFCGIFITEKQERNTIMQNYIKEIPYNDEYVFKIKGNKILVMDEENNIVGVEEVN